jgi:hypothetical protein
MNTTNEIITLVGHSRSVRCLHVDGTNEVRLVSGSNDHSIKVSGKYFLIRNWILLSQDLEYIYYSNMVKMCL